MYVLTLPICCGVISALEADTFLANCPANSCTSGMFEVIPEKERKEKREREKSRRRGGVLLNTEKRREKSGKSVRG